jgi:D-amino-acid dehydrogenase
MAAGTGQLLADWIAGRTPAIDTEGLTIARYGEGAVRAGARGRAASVTG